MRRRVVALVTSTTVGTFGLLASQCQNWDLASAPDSGEAPDVVSGDVATDAGSDETSIVDSGAVTTDVVAPDGGGDEGGSLRPGELDPSYEGPMLERSGFVVVPLSMIVDSKDRVLIMGNTYDGKTAMLIRLLPNGQLDTSFGPGGRALLSATECANGFAAFSAALAVADTIVVGGYCTSATTSQAVLLRFDERGVRDTQVAPGASGVVTVGPNAINVTSMGRQSNDQIILVGVDVLPTGEWQVFAEARRDINTLGAFVAGSKNRVTVPIETNEAPTSLAIGSGPAMDTMYIALPDNDVVEAGPARGLKLLKLGPDGVQLGPPSFVTDAINAGFGVNGASIFGVAVRTSGKVAVTGFNASAGFVIGDGVGYVALENGSRFTYVVADDRDGFYASGTVAAGASYDGAVVHFGRDDKRDMSFGGSLGKLHVPDVAFGPIAIAKGRLYTAAVSQVSGKPGPLRVYRSGI